MSTLYRCICTLFITASFMVYTQDAHAQDNTSAIKLTPETTEGEIRKVDKESKKITIKHGEIKHLEMPAMTMVFQLTDPAALDQLKVGEKVRFRVEKIGGSFVIKEIQALK